MGYPLFGMIDLLKLVGGLLVDCSDRMQLAKPRWHFSASSFLS
jgi:hypothetical protein